MTAIGKIYRDYKINILATKTQKQVWDELFKEYDIKLKD
jgi:hypothetical protein